MWHLRVVADSLLLAASAVCTMKTEIRQEQATTAEILKLSLPF